MSLRLWLLLLGAVLLGVVSFIWYDTLIVTAATSFLLSLQKFKWLVFLGVLRNKVLVFLLVKVPQKLLTSLAMRYLQMKPLVEWITEKALWLRENWREHLGFRFVIYMIISLVLVYVSLWQLGIWLLVFYEVEQVINAIFSYIWKSLEGTAFQKSLTALWRWLEATRLGQWVKHVNQRFDEMSNRAEELGTEHRKRAGLTLTIWWFEVSHPEFLYPPVRPHPHHGHILLPPGDKVCPSVQGPIARIKPSAKRHRAKNPAIKR